MVKTLRSRGLCEPGQGVLVALSGGPDSVALVRLLHRLAPRWKLRLAAVHFNYGLRGAESDADQAFVTSLCESLDIPLQCVPLDVRTRPRRVSVQAQARTLRYQAMRRVAEACGADRIALGHTADDQAETVVLWMLRGAGLAGLGGMPAAREGQFIRPLYDLRRRDLVAWLGEVEQPYRVDSTNGKPLYLRNRIRQELMPVLGRIAPSAIEALCRLADLCREDETYLESQVAATLGAIVHADGQGGWTLERGVLRSLPLAMQRRVLREIVRRCDSMRRPPGVVTVDALRRMLRADVVAGAHVFRGGVASVAGDTLGVRPSGQVAHAGETEDAAREVVVAIPSEIEWAGTGQRIRVQLWPVEAVPQPEARSEWRMVLDADRVGSALAVRAWRSGDRLRPSGMGGRSKKLQDLFVDMKVPKAMRQRIPVLVSSQGIVGVLGYRQDERFSVSRGTRRCLVVVVTGPEKHKGER